MVRHLVIFVWLVLASVTSASQARGENKTRPTLEEYRQGKANATSAAAAEAAIEKKMSAVDKVISMMKELRSKVIGEGSAEAELYNKFACFCKDTQEKKSAAISKGADDKAELTSAINKLATDRNGLDATISSLESDIATLSKEMKVATSSRAQTNAEYTVNEKDTSAAIFALEKAIQSLKVSKSPASASLLQVQSATKALQNVMLMADALGFIHSENSKVAAIFLQSTEGEAPAVEMEDYKFHSNDIISTLEQLLNDFKDMKVTLDKDEVKSVQSYQMLMQTKTDMMKAKKDELNTANADREQKIASIAANSEELSVTASTLLDDQKYLMELNELCAGKAKTWDQRNSMRSGELATLTEVIGILESGVKTNTSAATVRLVQQGSGKISFGAFTSSRSESDMEAIEAMAEDEEAQDASPLGFLQRRQKRLVQPHLKMKGREAVGAMLKSEGAKLRSTLLTALGSRIQGGADPFAKIKVMIQEIIDKLLSEETSEANQKGYCDKQIADSTQKRTYAAEKVDALNANLAELEATRDNLEEGIATLQGEIKDLKDNQAEQEKQRTDESATNEATVKEAKAGLAAINMAIDIISKRYKTYAKAEVSLSQGSQGPADDAPDAGFKNLEAYKGAQAESSGIIGMMDVIKSDFARTISETSAEEAAAKEEYLNFMTDSSKSIAEKETAEVEKTKIKRETEANIDGDKGKLESEMAILQASVAELIQFKAECIDTGMSYDERVARREDEIADLKKALCILENYGEYGDGAEATTC